MLNWPGAKTTPSAPSTGSSSRVAVSCVSRPIRRTWNGRGSMGSAPAGGATDRSLASPVDIQQLEPCGVQTLPDDLREPLQQFVPEPRIGLALPADAGAIECRRPGEVDRPSVGALGV